MTIYEISEEEGWGTSTWSSSDRCCCTCAILCALWRPFAASATGTSCPWTRSENLNARQGRRPVAEFNGSGEMVQWWVPNPAGHERMLYSAGFSIDRTAGPFPIGLGPGHPARGSRPGRMRARLRQRLQGGPGVPHAAVLGSPRL